MYPSLESDEEDLANKAKMKRKKNWEDTPWSPKGDLSDQQRGQTGFLIVMIIKGYLFPSQPGWCQPSPNRIDQLEKEPESHL